LEVRAETRDSRMPSHDRLDGEGSEDGDHSGLTSLDMDFFPSNEPAQGRVRRTTKKTHTFGQTENIRGDDDPDNEADDEVDGHDRARRRAAGLPIIYKSRTALSFPLIDSFPHIYADSSSDLSPASVSVHTSLSTDSAVALRVKALSTIIYRSIGLDEREALSNSLGEIAEAYEEGWDSGSDEDDD